jgi:hypothetical protein
VPLALARHGVPAARRAPLAWATALLGAHLALYAGWRLWWGGATFGPRLLTDLVPVLAWIAALALRAARTARAEAPARRLAAPWRVGGRAAIAALLLWGAVAHGAGALSARATRLVREAVRPEQLWDWRRSPPLVLLGARPADEPAPRAERPAVRRSRPRRGRLDSRAVSTGAAGERRRSTDASTALRRPTRREGA